MHPEMPEYVSVIFTVVTAFGVLLQALVLLGMFLGLRETQKKLTQALDKINEHLYPALGTTRQLLEDVSPKIKVITSNLVETSETIRQEVHHIDNVVGEVVDKSRVQAARVDGMVSDTLNSVAHAARTVEDGIAAPIRQIHGVLNGVRAGLDVLRSRSRRDHSAEDGDLFV